MKKIYYILFVALVLAGLGTGFYFRDQLRNFYRSIGSSVQILQKTDLQNVVTQATKEFFSPPPLQTGGSETGAVLVAAKIIGQTNIQRYDNGLLPPLIENIKLDAAAKAKAEDILKLQYFEHVSPSGLTPDQLVKLRGYDYIVSGENLILGNFANEKELVQAWMDSPGHRANILNDRFADIGVAIIQGTYQGHTVWVGVQEFGLALDACPAPSTPLKKQIDKNKIQLDSLSAQIESKKTEIEDTNPRDSNYNLLVDQYNRLVEQYNILANATKDLISQYNGQVHNFNQCVQGGMQ